MEASISGGMSVIQAKGPSSQVPPPQHTEPINPTSQKKTTEGTGEEATRAEKAYQGMMDSLLTFLKNSTPPDLTDDQLDGITSYFSIPITNVDTRLALPREQLYLPCIKEDSTDPDLTFGHTFVYVEAFSYGMRYPSPLS
ncbi:hypothetical protein LIER_28944 [Lithospermum erythrorhizon]|uniref:Uncharacterized protein n=1 Tax=Lithospermum erythrorhizon TaxID=34254 RepID=A0AAV3RLQ1_LITER